MAQQSLQVVIIGAGYAGLLATVRLAGKVRRQIERGDVAITLVNAADLFVERPRLHQLAANQPIVQRPIADMLPATGVAFIRGTVTSIDVARRAIEAQTETGTQQIGYDYLMYALGSTIDRESVPGAADHAYALTASGPNSAVALRERLARLSQEREGARLLVCGGGPTGIEAAAEFAEAYPGLRVQLVTQDAFGSFTRPRVAAYMRRSLSRLGVDIQDYTSITMVRADEVLTASGAVLRYDICLWAGGFAVPRLAREAGLSVNERGQILIDPFMRSISHPEIYAVGDAAHPLEAPGVAVRMAAFTAVVMGAHGADCLSAVLQGKQPKPFSFAYAGQGIALGRRDAIGFNTYPNDNPNWPYFTGIVGYEVREFFVRLLAELTNLERRWPGFFFWLGKRRYTASKRQAGISSPAQSPAPRPRHDRV
jgi:NADH dehydrogenase FAD-containing subunit